MQFRKNHGHGGGEREKEREGEISKITEDLVWSSSGIGTMLGVISIVFTWLNLIRPS